jgi:3' terminal RNA ribose 2'-O-methyltransferase Hen1
VLIPVSDDDKHYFVGEDEVEKLIAKGGEWLSNHPEREFIARRYLKRRRTLIAAALQRLDVAEPDEEAPEEDAYEARFSLHDVRLDWVAERIRASGVSSLVDLGCGEGKLIGRLQRIGKLTRIIGLDPSTVSLQRAVRRLKLDAVGGAERERVQLLHGALTYRDTRWAGVEAAALVEVIEHLDPDRLPAATKLVFGAGLKLVIVTTPNVEFNALFGGLAPGALRHPDHRFEWTRAEFSAWAHGVCEAHGYKVEITGLGFEDPTHGAVSQAAAFTR